MEIPTLKNIITDSINGIGNTAANIISKLKADPTKVAEAESDIEQLKINASIEAEKIANQAEEIQSKELETINETIRQEGKSEHWIVWSWRPLIGFTFCGMIIYNYIIAPACKLEQVIIPGDVWSAMLVILGAASAGRSFEKTMGK